MKENSFITHCQFCGKTYEAQRKSSKFCSDKCRLKSSRERVSSVHADLELYKIRGSLLRLENLTDDEIMKHSFDFEQMFNRLDKLRERRKELFDSLFGGGSTD